MFCSNCGTQLADGVSFCPTCGTAQKKAAGPAGEGTPTPPPESTPVTPRDSGPEAPPVQAGGDPAAVDYAQPAYPQQPGETPPAGNGKRIGLIAALAVVVVIVVVAVVQVVGGAPSMDEFVDLVLDENFIITDRSESYDLSYFGLGSGEVSYLEAESYTGYSELMYMSIGSKSTAETTYNIAKAAIKSEVGEGSYPSASYGETESGGWQIYYYIDYSYDEFFFIAQQGEYLLLCAGDTDDEYQIRNVMSGIGIKSGNIR